MAYRDRSVGSNQRAAVAIAVAVLQGAAIVALVNGLAVKFIERPPDVRLSGEQIRIEPPKPPEPPKPEFTQKADDRQITRVKTPIDLGSVTWDPPETVPIPTPLPTGTSFVDPPKPPPPPFTPAMARPIGSPGAWVIPNDYPASELRQGHQGKAGFRVVIDTRGTVTSCTVTRSSGYPALDVATCTAVTRRARFKPATDGFGQPVSGEYGNNIVWVIPD